MALAIMIPLMTVYKIVLVNGVDLSKMMHAIYAVVMVLMILDVAVFNLVHQAVIMPVAQQL